MNRILFLIFLISFFSCKNKKSSDSDDNHISYTNTNEFGYKDGTYCAEIEYYYSKTSTQSTYTLKVEIESNELVTIYWPNGGWLDESHFYPPDISDGTAYFESDEGVQYSIEIIGEDRDCHISYSAPDESSFVEEEKDQICPICGGHKYSFDEYCDYCSEELEDEDDEW